jgi:hypothetical protein
MCTDASSSAVGACRQGTGSVVGCVLRDCKQTAAGSWLRSSSLGRLGSGTDASSSAVGACRQGAGSVEGCVLRNCKQTAAGSWLRSSSSGRLGSGTDVTSSAVGACSVKGFNVAFNVTANIMQQMDRYTDASSSAVGTCTQGSVKGCILRDCKQPHDSGQAAQAGSAAAPTLAQLYGPAGKGHAV